MTITEDWTLVNQVHDDPAPLPHMHRIEVLKAIINCAETHDGLVHASWVRDLLPEGVDEHMRGNVVSHLSRAGSLRRTGRYLPSGDAKNRNRTRGLPVFRVTSMARLAEAVAE